MRAIAVLAVVLYHAGIGPGAGFVGVDIFFVISGYLITSLLLAEWQQNGRIGFLDFYARRARRIVPAALLVALVTVLASRVLLPPAAFTDVLDSSAAASVFVSNLYFQAVTGGYFDSASAEMPLLHLWSLSVEEQFYLVWPALLALVLYRRPRNLVLVLSILAIGSFALAAYLMRFDPEAAFYQTPARFWELCCGGLVASFPRRRIPAPWLASIVTGALLASTMALVGNFPGFGALPAVVLSASLLWLIHGNNELGIAGQWLRSWPMVAVGRVSYSFYLWHWPLLALFAATAIGADATWARAGLCVLALALSALSYRYVEQPFRRLKTRPGPTVAMAIGLSVVIAAVSLAWSSSMKEEERLRPRDNPFAARVASDQPKGWRRCHYQVGSIEFPRKGCESIPGVRPQVVMWGDSMALAWKPLAWELGRFQGVSAVDYSRDACPPAVDYLPANPLPGHLKCRDFNSSVVAALRPDVTVILAMRLGDADNEARTALLANTLQVISPLVKHVHILGPSPEIADYVPKCIRANQLDSCAISRTDFDSIAGPTLRRLRAEAVKYPNVSVIDVSGYFCDETACPAVRDGVGLYWDNHHVSATAASAIAKRLAPELSPQYAPH